MELRHLRYMLALAEHRSFTRAARAVHITQSTLSHQVRQLELEIGRDLFDRSGRDVTLTEAGRTLLPGVQRALAELNEAIRVTKDFAPQCVGHVRILAGSRGCARRVIASALTATDPAQQVRASIEEVLASSMPERLQNGADAFEIIVGDFQHVPNGWTFEPLYCEELGVLAPACHPFAHRRRVRLAELHGEPLVLPSRPEPTRLIIDDVLEHAGVRPHIVAELNLVEAAFEAARANRALMIGPPNYHPSDSELSFVPLEDPVPERTIGFMWRYGATMSPSIRSLTDRIRKRVSATVLNDQHFLIRPCSTISVIEPEFAE